MKGPRAFKNEGPSELFLASLFTHQNGRLELTNVAEDEKLESRDLTLQIDDRFLTVPVQAYYPMDCAERPRFAEDVLNAAVKISIGHTTLTDLVTLKQWIRPLVLAVNKQAVAAGADLTDENRPVRMEAVARCFGDRSEGSLITKLQKTAEPKDWDLHTKRHRLVVRRVLE
ncbi:hypothetical protein GNI_124280 [Gregarina niphandrodes]|uniref:Uncharacterized protein n=1 Tax=Gregarina niphandrodes TaxID=110365 RepID=A0A023B269_GRENI|nr:hypothetical protein GNI_124280 [Gregarina niphandrodes]EZG51519.1 hypothetical protein GNI_124280 [Gregarina niphandrodes]|eukprot:XP_011131957.1 hypothetical protein GNI_124280 [Gregarina niphandrodes]